MFIIIMKSELYNEKSCHKFGMKVHPKYIGNEVGKRKRTHDVLEL